MADEINPNAVPNVGLPRLRDQQYREIYVNGSFTGMSPYDVTLYMTKATDMGGQTVIVDHVGLVMSPQHFKQFHGALTESLKAYEAVFGELKIPEADIAPATTAKKIEEMLLDARARATAMRAVINKPTSSSTEKKRPSQRSRGASREKS